ncbi:hypothetical protein BBJ28_00012310 [Nothophytophthora sp. Chile5]|nr:hypothetical protein BBJ28_00012310 [Nothophytophthora sp. Chile5]
MGTWELFSRTYCAGRRSCVLVDAWLELFLLLCSIAVLCGLLVASRCCWLCSRNPQVERTSFSREGSMVHRVLTGQSHGRAWRVRRLLRHCGARILRRTAPLPLAVIQKDAATARIQAHKNSQQQGAAFIMQTQRMYHLDLASQPSASALQTDEAIETAFPMPPMVFPADDTPASTHPPSDHQALTRSGSTVASAPNHQKVPTQQFVHSATAPQQELHTSSPTSDAVENSASNSFRQKFSLFKRRGLAQKRPQPMFVEPSYEAKHELAELSPGDRVKNERRASLQRSDKRRLSVGANSRLQFEVGGAQASVYEVNLREVNLVKRLAFGPLSEVYAAIWRDTKVGVKLLMPREGVVDHLEEAVKNFRREIWVMNALQHRNIVKLLGASLTHSCYVLVMEYMPNGSLYEYLRDAANFFPQQLVVTSAFDLASGMAHVHASGVLQRDLKSKNCLLSENLVVKVADFGLSRFQDKPPGASYTWVGTPFWAAPEVIRHEPYDDKADVYSFAIVLWELVERKDPYDHLNAFQVPLQVANDGLRPHDFTKPAPLGLGQLMHQCWDADPEQRPSFADIAHTLETWLHCDNGGGAGDGSALKTGGHDVDLSAHIQREQNAVLPTELHRFAESHDANEKAIPITLSSLRRGLPTTRLQRQRSTRKDFMHSEVGRALKNGLLDIPRLEPSSSAAEVTDRVDSMPRITPE